LFFGISRIRFLSRNPQSLIKNHPLKLLNLLIIDELDPTKLREKHYSNKILDKQCPTESSVNFSTFPNIDNEL